MKETNSLEFYGYGSLVLPVREGCSFSIRIAQERWGTR